ncbi:MAG: hypothetical protein ABII00_01210 [Elusimicrobiota bacterium]
MGKRHRKRAAEKARERKGGEGKPLSEETITSRGKKTIAAGIALLVVGFFVLTLTDPEGRNWASQLSPLLILGAYAVIAVGIFLPESDAVAPDVAELAAEAKGDDVSAPPEP